MLGERFHVGSGLMIKPRLLLETGKSMTSTHLAEARTRVVTPPNDSSQHFRICLWRLAQINRCLPDVGALVEGQEGRESRESPGSQGFSAGSADRAINPRRQTRYLQTRSLQTRSLREDQERNLGCKDLLGSQTQQRHTSTSTSNTACVCVHVCV